MHLQQQQILFPIQRSFVIPHVIASTKLHINIFSSRCVVRTHLDRRTIRVISVQPVHFHEYSDRDAATRFEKSSTLISRRHVFISLLR